MTIVKEKVGYNPDRAALCIHNAMLQDFRRVQGQSFLKGWELFSLADVIELRSKEIPELGEIPVHRFKMYAQVKTLLKRHTFHNDVLTKKELERKSFVDFLENQSNLATPREFATVRTFPVLQEARKIAKSILGKVDLDQVACGMKHGKRSVMGVQLMEALLDAKLLDPNAACMPPSLLQWFFSFIADCPLTRKLAGLRAGFQLADYLNLSTVPKSWKILRMITPLTVWALFFSHGVASVVTDSLKSVGIDISKQQERHKIWARIFSRTRTHVTADLSKASDSITLSLLMAVLPREWYNLLRPLLVTRIKYGKKYYHVMSVLPMGNGATFPIETLIFYCLIKAVGNLLKKDGLYSVYGDDLIYPRAIHVHVAKVFSELGIKMNLEKTFSSSFFRESCGGDYYHGIDVRPAMLPECDRATFTKTEYKAWLYKTYNTLQARWSMEHELQETNKWLLMELSSLSRWVFQVPPSYPDHCGIKSMTFKSDWYLNWFTPRREIDNAYTVGTLPKVSSDRPDQMEGKVLVWRFRGLEFSKEKVPISNELPYLWDRLRAARIKSHCRPPYVWWKSWTAFHEFAGSTTIESVPLVDQKGKPLLNKRGKQRYIRCVMSPALEMGQFRTNTFSTSCWE